MVNVYEQGSSRDTTTQASYRSTLKSTAAGFSPAAQVLDWYDQWTALGVGTYLTARTPGGLLDAGSVHPSQLGYLDLTQRVYWWLRNQLGISAALSSAYAASGNPPAVAYAAKMPTVAYSTGAPISI